METVLWEKEIARRASAYGQTSEKVRGTSSSPVDGKS